MSNFDFVSFGYNSGDNDMFVAHAKKYSVAETIELCKIECDYLFKDRVIRGKVFKALKKPTTQNIHANYCAFVPKNYDWPDGCYTLVSNSRRGSFPVWVINFSELKQ